MSNEQDSHTEWLETKVTLLAERVTDLERCCTQRGARMQILKCTLDKVMMGKEVPLERWQQIIQWFDEDNVPLDGETVRVSGVPYRVSKESLR